ncbi:MAG: LPS export ABC transporter periplasmic protein LptC [Bacteroidota bacterium]
MKGPLTLILMLLLMMACSEEERIPSLASQAPDDVLVESFGVEYLFSDSSRVNSRMKAYRVIEREEEGEAEGDDKIVIHYLSGGVKVEFLNNRGNVHSFIQADSGKFHREKEKAELWGNVFLKNHKDEELKTQQLFWDKEKDSVYTKKFVQITTADKMITGDGGFVSNTDFTAYTIYGTRGEMEIEDDEGLN